MVTLPKHQTKTLWHISGRDQRSRAESEPPLVSCGGGNLKKLDSEHCRNQTFPPQDTPFSQTLSHLSPETVCTTQGSDSKQTQFE